MFRIVFLFVTALIFLAGFWLFQNPGLEPGPVPDSGNVVSYQSVAGLPDVVAVRVSSTPDRARVVVDMAATSAYSFVSLQDPMRIAVDVRASGIRGKWGGAAAGGGLVTHFQVTQLAPDRVRATLFLADGAQVSKAQLQDGVDDQPARLVVELEKVDPETFARNAQADRDAFERALQAAGDRSETSGAPDEDAGAATTGSEETVVTDTGNTDDPSAEPLADEAEAGAVMVPASARPLILIDPGHGGVDGGAMAASGLEEKTVTLEFARALRDALIETGRFEVALTRENDTFFRLEQRVQLARDNKADLFISIHADSFEDTTIRGASVYIRDEQATDVLDKVLADNENKADLLAGFPVETEQRQVVDLLVELMRREMRRLSFMAANAIVGELKNSVRVRRFPMRRADFFVLQSPDVPAILLELGFLSNLSDVENFTSPVWRKRAAEAVVRGISTYFEQTRQ